MVDEKQKSAVAEEQDIHPVVDLMLRRMETHPEEFFVANSRWDSVLDVLRHDSNENEQALVNSKLRRIRLDEVHTLALDELCNGEERRRLQREQYDAYARQSAFAQNPYNSQMQPLAGSPVPSSLLGVTGNANRASPTLADEFTSLQDAMTNLENIVGEAQKQQSRNTSITGWVQNGKNMYQRFFK